MIVVWIVAVTIGGLVYVAFLALIISGLASLRRRTNPVPGDAPTVSVVIAARNEENRIGRTLEQLLAQDYPRDRLEIIVVDDRSEDATADVVEEFAGRNPCINLVRQTSVDPSESPKKQALQLGIRTARSGIIATTDADCSPPAGWLTELVKHLAPGVGMVIGQARFETGVDLPLWQRLQALDYRSQGIAAAGLARIGIPFNCSGASLAFRREMFNSVGGWGVHRRLVSGDDELLMSRAVRGGWKVAVALGPDAVVMTAPPENLRRLWNQRLRWGSKGVHYRPSRVAFLAGLFLFLLTMTLGPVVWALGGPGLLWLGWGCIKLGLDWVALSLGGLLFDERLQPGEFLLLELVHPLLIVLFAVGGHIASFEWKGKRYRSRGAVGR